MNKIDYFGGLHGNYLELEKTRSLIASTDHLVTDVFDF